jgi:hypothetical protein
MWNPPRHANPLRTTQSLFADIIFGRDTRLFWRLVKDKRCLAFNIFDALAMHTVAAIDMRPHATSHNSLPFGVPSARACGSSVGTYLGFLVPGDERATKSSTYRPSSSISCDIEMNDDNEIQSHLTNGGPSHFVVMTPIGGHSSPATMAIRMRVQNASSMSWQRPLFQLR